jgi:AcrR family transcriptional regulator
MTELAGPQRADARRNRERLIEAAGRAFASGGQNVTLEAIAKATGVGIGTLYRHFPTREALVEAVYHDQVAGLHQGAQDLLVRYGAARALRQWMDLFADWVATKHGMIDTLRAMISSGDIAFAQTRSEIVATIGAMLAAGTAAGELRGEVEAEDVLASLAGIMAVAGTADRREQAGRLFDLIMDGLRASPAQPAADHDEEAR